MKIQYDPIEKTEKYKSIENELEVTLSDYKDELIREADMIFEKFGIMPSICHRMWRKKKEILHDKYGIEWKTPAEMNPDINFD